MKKKTQKRMSITFYNKKSKYDVFVEHDEQWNIVQKETYDTFQLVLKNLSP